MTLQQKLNDYKEQFKRNAPAEAQLIMSRATEDLRKSGILDGAIQEGDKLPEFLLNNQDGRPVSSIELLRKGPLVINFYRGVWCPYCNIELESLNEVYPEIVARGAQLVSIAPQLEESALKNKQDKSLGFDILVDKGNHYARKLNIVFQLPDDLVQIYKQFGIVLPDHNGDDSWELPMPARLVINQGGIVIYANVSPDYTERPEPAEILSILDAEAEALVV